MLHSAFTASKFLHNKGRRKFRSDVSMDDDVFYCVIFLKHLLPALYDLKNTKQMLVMSDRSKAIKDVADRSLALSASGFNWSAALERYLLGSSEKVVDFAGTRDDVAEISSASETVYNGILSRDAAQISAWCFLSILNTISKQFPSLHFVVEKGNRQLKFGMESDSLSNRFKRNFSKSHSGIINYHSNPAVRYRRIIFKRKSRRSPLLKRITLARCRRSKFPNKSKTRNHLISKSLLVNHKAQSWKEEQLQRDRIATLRSIIPGGDSMSKDHLMSETADYIKFLKCQVDVLASLVVIGAVIPA